MTIFRPSYLLSPLSITLPLTKPNCTEFADTFPTTMLFKLSRKPSFSPEILSRILRLYLDPGESSLDEFLHIPIRQNSPNPITFGLVCREWRDVSTSRTPQIWSSLHIELPEALEERDAMNLPPLITQFLARSQNLPLTVRLVIYPALGAISYLALGQVFSAILAQSHRWQDFFVMATPHSLPLLLQSTVLQAPISRLIPWSALQSLNFSGVTLPLQYMACEEILRSCSSLRHCQLAIDNGTRYSEISPPPIMLPNLETLHLIDKSLPSHTHPIYELFLCPNLRELTITHEGDQQLSSQQLESARVSLMKFLRRDMSQLYLLHLFEIPVSEAGLYDMICSAPEQVTHLLLSHRGCNSPITSGLLSELALDLPSESTSLDDDASSSSSEMDDACSECDVSSINASDLGGTDSDQDSLIDHPILYTLFPYLVDISIISNACSDQAIELFLRSRWAAEWHVAQLRNAKFDLLGRTFEPNLSTRLSDCCAAGLVLQVGDAGTWEI